MTTIPKTDTTQENRQREVGNKFLYNNKEFEILYSDQVLALCRTTKFFDGEKDYIVFYRADFHLI